MGDLKDKIIAELKNTKRMGIDELIEAMEDGGFFEAPCSGKIIYHLAEPEGLMKHSWNVLTYMRKLNEAWNRMIPDDSLTIVALLHDLGKMGDHGKPNYVENILKTGQSKAEPYKTNKDLIYIPHEVRSVMIAERYIYLTEEEETAILWHNGLYSASFRNDIPGKETIIYLALHSTDMYVSRFVEVSDGDMEDD